MSRCLWLGGRYLLITLYPTNYANTLYPGCFDEHPRCQDWAQNGMCLQNGLFMAHTCRESCGVCGFLSATNSASYMSFYQQHLKQFFIYRKSKLLVASPTQITRRIILTAEDSNFLQKLMVKRNLRINPRRTTFLMMKLRLKILTLRTML